MIARRILAGLLAGLLLVGIGYWWGHNAAGNTAAAAAVAAERSAAVVREFQNAEDRKVERTAATDLFNVSSNYQKGLSHVATTQKNVVAGVRSGTVRLSVPTKPAAAPGAAPLAADPGRCDGPARAQLSDEAAEFFTGLATEADAIVLQLTACQRDLKIEVEACNRESPNP
jgi:hypothetical protein